MAIIDRYTLPDGRPVAPFEGELRVVMPALIEAFKKHGVALAYLFGSYARGEAEKYSDVDIAVLFDRDSTSDTFELYDDVYEILDTERFDLVDLNTPNIVFKFEVVSTGQVIYRKDIDVENNFEMAVLREYQDTNYLRRVQQNILKERVKEWF